MFHDNGYFLFSQFFVVWKPQWTAENLDREKWSEITQKEKNRRKRRLPDNKKLRKKIILNDTNMDKLLFNQYKCKKCHQRLETANYVFDFENLNKYITDEKK